MDPATVTHASSAIQEIGKVTSISVTRDRLKDLAALLVIHHSSLITDHFLQPQIPFHHMGVFEWIGVIVEAFT